MAHPYLGQVKASQRARLRRLGAKPGKAWGSSSMYKKKSYPKKNAGSEREFTIPGGKARKRADRMANGGAVKSRHRPHHTTNIVIAAPGGAGGRGGGGGGGGRGHPGLGMPLPVRPPIGGPPVGAAPPPIGGMPPLGAGGPPAGLAGAPVARPALPVGGAGAPMPVRPAMGPPGMKRGGHVKKRKIGGADDGGGGYPGFPYSPTKDTDAVSAHAHGGQVGASVRKRQSGGTLKRKNGGDSDDDDAGAAGEMPAAGAASAPPEASEQTSAASAMPTSLARAQKRGGKVKKRQLGGGSGLPYGGLMGPRPGIQTAMPVQQGAPTLSGRPALPAQRQMIPAPNTLASQRLRPAPGTQVGFKRGGKAKHPDEAEDKKLFKRMYKEEETKEAKEGKEEKVKKRKDGGFTGLPGVINRDEGRGMGSAREMANPYDARKMMGVSETPGKVKRRKFGGAAGETTTARGLAGKEYHDWGVGYRQDGGNVKPRPGAGSGLGRIRANRIAGRVPAKTEL